MRNGYLLKSRVSEICLIQILIKQGDGVDGTQRLSLKRFKREKKKAVLTIDLKKIFKERLLSRLTTRLLLIREKEVNFNFPLSLLTAVVSSFSFCLISSWPIMG